MADPNVAALLDLGNPAAFEALMRTLTNPDNSVRDPAENSFNECKKLPDQCTTQLVQVLRTSPHEDARLMCAVLLRKVLTKDVHDDEGNTLWVVLRPETQNGIKAELLKSLVDAPSRSISRKVCDTISEIAAILQAQGWPELLPFMFQCVQSPEDRHKESALLIFSQLAHCITPALQPYLGTLHDVLGGCMQGTVNFDVRIVALKATINFILSIESQQDSDRFQDLVPVMLQTLGAALEASEEAQAQEALEALIDLAEEHPRFLRAQLGTVLNVMTTIAETDSFEDSSRNYAVEFLLTLAGAREKAPGMLRKAPQFVQRLFQALLMFLLDIEDEPAWHTAEDNDDEGGLGERYDVGQEGLDRLSIAMGGKTILPLASQMLPPCLNDGDWRMRHAGLIALSQIAEGCAKLIEDQKQVGPISELVLAKMNDPHPRVRWAAVHAIGQMCTDLGPALQKEQHARILPALLQVMDDHANPRVQAHGSAAVVNFSESCPKETMMLYCDALITKLMVLLQSGKKVVMEGALTALASVADCAQNEFQKYYDTVMPYLKDILATATDKTHRMLRAKSMECISLVGMAVGKERFYTDAVAVMDVLVQLQRSKMDDDDPTVSYMLQAWARLCKCLQSAFLPYLPFVMPPLLKSAHLKTDVTVKDVDDVDENEDDDDWETIELGDKRISIRTSVLEEKATACNMLFCYADELKEGFYPYVEEVVQLMVPLLKFYVHEDVRNAAVTALPELLNDAKLAVEKGMTKPEHNMQWLKGMMDFIFKDLCEAVVKEPEVEIVSNMLEALHEIIDYGGELLAMDPTMMQQQLGGVVEMFKQVLKKSQQRMEERQSRPKEDFDEEELEALEEENEQETNVYDQVAECISSFLKKFKSQFLPYLDQLMPQILPLLGPERSSEERCVALCIFDDIVEHANETGEASRYYEHFLPTLLSLYKDDNCDVRQCAVYGFGALAQHGGDAVQQIVPDMAAKLMEVIHMPESRTGDNEGPTDNAVSALGKMCQYQRNASFDVASAMSAWLNYLPLKGDKEEAHVVHEALCKMVESGDAQLLGASQERLPNVVKVFSQIVNTDLVKDEVKPRIRDLLMRMQTNLPPQQVAGIWGVLSPEEQQGLQMFLQNTPSSVASPQ